MPFSHKTVIFMDHDKISFIQIMMEFDLLQECKEPTYQFYLTELWFKDEGTVLVIYALAE